jgi:hypothetical protein
VKDILGHKSRSLDEIVEILRRQGTYTCPTLPHYRYDRVKSACARLRRAQLLAVSGRNAVSVNLVVTGLFLEWQTASASGETALGPLKWAKIGVPGQPEPVA